MMFAPRRLRITAVLLLPLLLSACLASDVPFFDAAKGEKPLQTGKYVKQEYLLGHWINQEKGQLTLTKLTYEWRKENTTVSDDGETKTDYDVVEHEFTIHGIGGGQFVALKSCQECDTKYLYDLIELSEGDILQYAVDCETARLIRNAPLLAEARVCKVENAANLLDVLRGYSKRRFPKYRYVRYDAGEP